MARKVYFEGDGLAFGNDGQYYKWIVPFVNGSEEFDFEEVSKEVYDANREKEFPLSPIEVINAFIKKRAAILEANPEDKEAESIETAILVTLVIPYFETYPCDFIIETLTKLGQAPNIMYDDNGLFAVSGAGYQPVVTGDEKLEGIISVLCTPEMWQKTIREAIWHYLTTQTIDENKL